MMLHPATAHFAMVLPIVATVFGLIYLYTRTEGMSKISSRLTAFAALAMIGVWYTGSQAGPEIYDYLSDAGKHTLIEHKDLGLYLAIAMGVIALLKLVGCKMKLFWLEAVAVVLLVAASGATLVQGKHGGEIVYNHGMPFQSYMIQDTLNEAVQSAEESEEDEEKVEIYEDAIDEVVGMSEEIGEIYGNVPSHEDEDEE